MNDVTRLAAALVDRHRAQDPMHDRKVTVKVLRPELLGVLAAL